MARQFGNMNAPQNVDLGKQPKSKKKRDKKHSEVIDIDAETSDRKKNMASAEVVRPFNKQPHALIEDKDVVDVTYEIEE
ncbi:MAG: hypothetical protein J6A01_05140 [Proteobacteria bacterium]|nr:hypothetical protein [Pseudomonadota bacterium]